MNNLHFIGCDKAYEESDIVIVGAPFDGTVSFRPGTRFAPNVIRTDSDGLETYSPYLDKDLTDQRIHDYGDIDMVFGSKERSLNALYNTIKELIHDNKIPLTIGGEHLISYAPIKALSEKYDDLHVIQFDAHTDLRKDYMGEKFSHATVMRLAHELLGNQKIYQFGIRSGLKEEFDFASNYTTLEKFKARTVSTVAKTLLDKPIHLTIDLDVLDPSILPGTGTPEAGGLSYNELMDAVYQLKGLNIVGIDVVELSPHYDASGVSTAVAAKIIRECLLLLN